MMTTIISITILVGGAYIACVAERYPATSRHLDRAAGVMLIAGLSLVAASRTAIY